MFTINKKNIFSKLAIVLFLLPMVAVFNFAVFTLAAPDQSQVELGKTNKVNGITNTATTFDTDNLNSGCVCTMEFAPVCGKTIDGKYKTFSNKCRMSCVGAVLVSEGNCQGYDDNNEDHDKKIAIGDPGCKQGTKKPSSCMTDDNGENMDGNHNDLDGVSKSDDMDNKRVDSKESSEKSVNRSTKLTENKFDNGERNPKQKSKNETGKNVHENDYISNTKPISKKIEVSCKKKMKSDGSYVCDTDDKSKSDKKKTNTKKTLGVFQDTRVNGPGDDSDGDGLLDDLEEEEEYLNIEVTDSSDMFGKFLTKFLSGTTTKRADSKQTTASKIKKEVWVSARENKYIAIPGNPQW